MSDSDHAEYFSISASACMHSSLLEHQQWVGAGMSGARGLRCQVFSHLILTLAFVIAFVESRCHLANESPPGVVARADVWDTRQAFTATANATRRSCRLQVEELGILYIATTRIDIQRAFKSAASAREAAASVLEDKALHATLVTGALGLSIGRDFARSGVFDRVADLSDLDGLGHKNLVKNAPVALPCAFSRHPKLAALHAATRLYSRAIVVDVNTYFCDSKVLRQLAAATRTADFATASIDPPVLRQSPLTQEVLGVRVTDKLRRILQHWENTDHKCNGSTRPALQMPAKWGSQGAGLIHQRLDSSEGSVCTSLSDDRTECDASNTANCSVLAGNVLSGVNLRRWRGASAGPANWSVGNIPHTAVFVHIPKTAGHSIKTVILPWIGSVRNDTDFHVHGQRFSRLELRSLSINRRMYDEAYREWGSLSRVLERKYVPESYRAAAALRTSRSHGAGATFFGAFASGSCEYLSPSVFADVADATEQWGCTYFTMLRNPISRLISELNWCIEVNWYGDQTCAGERGADDLKAILSRRNTTPGAMIVEFAEARRNVMLEYLISRHPLRDFAFKDHRMSWHARAKSTRITSLETRRLREGAANPIDLMVAKKIISQEFALVGLVEMFNESVRRMSVLLTGRELNETLLGQPQAHSHNAKIRASSRPRFSRDQLTARDLNKVEQALALDLELYRFAVRQFEADPRFTKSPDGS